MQETIRPFSTVAEALSNNVRFTAPVVDAVKLGRASKLWRGTLDERKEKFQAMHSAFCQALEIEASLNLSRVTGRGLCLYRVKTRDGKTTIYLSGKLSFVTYLHAIGDAVGYEANARLSFAVNLFRKYFPRSFAACRQVGIFLVKK